MTDAPATSTTTPKKRKWVWAIAGGIVALALIAFFVSRAGLDKALVKQKLDEYIAAVKERAHTSGRDITITYGDLEVAGNFTGKHVIIRDVKVTVRPENEVPAPAGAKTKTDALTTTTSEIDVYPLSVDLSSARVVFPKPITSVDADDPGKTLLTVQAAAPLEFTVEHATVGEISRNVVSHTSPSSFALTFLREHQAGGTEDAAPSVTPVYDTLNVAIAGGGSFKTDFAADGTGKADLVYKAITMSPQSDPKAVVSIDTVETHWSNIINESKLNDITATLNVGPINAASELLAYAPVVLAFDAKYTGALPKTPQAVATTEAQNATFSLRKLVVSTKQASLNATGNFTAGPTDVLPVGKADITLTNLPFVLTELHNKHLINPMNEAPINDILEHVAGAPLATVKDLSVPIERERGGSFKIGKSTFEELFALLLKSAVQQKAGIPAPAATPPAPGTSAPALPPADKPKAAPIAVPDSGTRG